MEIEVKNFNDLRKILNDPRVTLNQAIRITEVYCKLIVLDSFNDKASFLILVESYIDEYENLASNFERPIFINLDLDVEN
jgi:hypothetical protein